MHLLTILTTILHPLQSDYQPATGAISQTLWIVVDLYCCYCGFFAASLHFWLYFTAYACCLTAYNMQHLLVTRQLFLLLLLFYNIPISWVPFDIFSCCMSSGCGIHCRRKHVSLCHTDNDWLWQRQIGCVMSCWLVGSWEE